PGSPAPPGSPITTPPPRPTITAPPYEPNPGVKTQRSDLTTDTEPVGPTVPRATPPPTGLADGKKASELSTDADMAKVGAVLTIGGLLWFAWQFKPRRRKRIGGVKA